MPLLRHRNAGGKRLAGLKYDMHGRNRLPKTRPTVGTPRWTIGRILIRALALGAGMFLAFSGAKPAWMATVLVDDTKTASRSTRSDILARRAYLIRRLHREGAGPNSMPIAIPAQFRGEWALVTHSMTAAALANIARMYPETRAESRQITGDLLRRVLREEFRQFDRRRWRRDPLHSMGARRGQIGYLGHLAFMLAAYHSLGGRDARLLRLFDRVSLTLARRLRRAPGYNARTYPGETYIPDNAVVVAALALHGRARRNSYTARTARLWIGYAGRHFRDQRTGVLAFHPGKSPGSKVSRSSGAGWTNFYLYYADPRFAREQARLTKKHFRNRALLFTGMTEFPGGGIMDIGDLDSGPLVLGFSPAGTGFAAAGARFTGDRRLARELLRSAEFAGFTIQWNGERRYLLAPLVGDAILLAMRTTVAWQ